MATRSRWDDVKSKRQEVPATTGSAIEQDFALAQMIYDLRVSAGLSQREFAERIGTTQSVISRLEQAGGSGNRVNTLARIATALGRHMDVSFPEQVPSRIKDGVLVA